MTDNSSDAVASPMTYRQKLNAIAAKFERMDVGIGHAYALQELRNSLNALSNEALQEQQKQREETPT